MNSNAPFSAGNFSVHIDGVGEVGFCEVSRLTSNGEPARVVMRRALTASKELYRWYERGQGGKRDTRDVVVNQHERAGGSVVNSWVLEGAWPCRWSGPHLNALDGAIAYEEVELAYDRLHWLDEPRQPRQPAKRGGR